jgi:putative ABC transport system permease protein
VMPPNFDFPRPDVQVWLPLALDPSTHSWGLHFLSTMARLKPGVTVEQAQTDVERIAEQTQRRDSEFRRQL